MNYMLLENSSGNYELPFNPYLLIVFTAVLVILIDILVIVIYNSTHFAVKRNAYDDLDDKLSNGRRNNANVSARYKVILTNRKNANIMYCCGMDTSIIIGNNSNKCDLVIENDDAVSGAHCEVGVTPTGYYIRDLNSKNGTFINTRRLTEAIIIKSGVTVRIGLSDYELKIIYN